MQLAFPEMQWFSTTNIKRMRKFVMAYPDLTIGAQAVHQLPWGHVVILLHRVKNKAHRDWYAQQTLELGQGFAYVGSQVPLNIDDQEFFIDLLFYHLELRCYCVIELKSTKFKPEHTGQLGFYLAVVDDQLRKPSDNKTIGILLCQSKNKIIAEYALQSSNAPIGISEYELTKAIPEKLKNCLPTIEELEHELNAMIEHENAYD